MSNKVINLNQNNEYKERVVKVFEFLEQTERDLTSEIIDLAVLGKWKKWSDEQPNGTEFEFTDEMLQNSGDENVDMLCDLRAELISITEKITKANIGFK